MPAIQPQTQQLVTKEYIHNLHFKTSILGKKHRITKSLELEGTSGDHPILLLCQGRVTWTR